jgi:hypothetical protein
MVAEPKDPIPQIPNHAIGNHPEIVTDFTSSRLGSRISLIPILVLIYLPGMPSGRLQSKFCMNSSFLPRSPQQPPGFYYPNDTR